MEKLPRNLGKNLLVALNDTEESLETIRILTRELRDPAKTKITLIHYLAPVYWEHGGFTEETVEILEEKALRKEVSKEVRTERFFDEAQAILEAAGVPPDQIDTMESWNARSVPDAILTEIELGNYSAVVIGRHHHDTLRRLLNLTLADYLRQHTDRTAVWVIDAPLKESEEELAPGRSAS
ncbi:MAG: universal stress protein [Anaerolineales bacterium]|nr:universal stress protein [Anaerolineales bacterium]